MNSRHPTMQTPFSAHNQFFTSLKHLEKRLKLENNEAAAPSALPQPPSPPPPPPPQMENHQIISTTEQTDSLGSPIYLCNQSANTDSSYVQESEVPQQFLSRSFDSPPTNHTPPHEPERQERVYQPERLNLGDDIELLMQLLHLSDDEMIVGVNSMVELERLEKWIKHFFNGEKKEPFRLAHLLLGKAASVHSDEGFGGLVFPSTIEEFLQKEPLID